MKLPLERHYAERIEENKESIRIIEWVQHEAQGLEIKEALYSPIYKTTMKTLTNIPVMLKSTFQLDWSFAFVFGHEWRRQKIELPNYRCE